MRNVRVYFSKKGRLKFVSHLDMNRFMYRVLRLSGIPIWYTEGFNPRPYVTFALPLSLGFQSENDVFDIRVTDDNFTNEQVKEALKNVVPEYLEITDVCDAVLKPGKIAYAKFLIEFFENKDNFINELSLFLMKDSIIVEKKGKNGKLKTVDLAPKIKDFSVSLNNDKPVLTIILPAGGADNVNPTLLLSAFGTLPYFEITRTAILDENLKQFM